MINRSGEHSIDHKPPRTARTRPAYILKFASPKPPLKSTNQTEFGLPALLEEDKWMNGGVQLQLVTVQPGVQPVLNAALTAGS